MKNIFKIDFACVGAVKAGTTWLYECLKEHPQLSLSHIKELNYFCTKHLWPGSNINNMYDNTWLKNQFHKNKSTKYYGEVSPSYLADPSNPSLLHFHNPKIKIIFMFRNPYEAFQSLYGELSKRVKLPETFELFVDQHLSLGNTFLYGARLDDYLKLFSMDQMHFIIFDDIKTKPERIIADIFSFLEIDNTVIPSVLNKRVNEKRSPNSILLRDSMYTVDKILNFLLPLKMKRFIGRMGLNQIAEAIQNLNLTKMQKANVSDACSLLLKQYFHDDIVKLSSLIQRDLTSWNH